MAETLHVSVRTPHGDAFAGEVLGLRVPTPTGLVGLRPRGEAIDLVLVPGLVLLRCEGALKHAATAGGLVESTGRECVIYTPFAAVGSEEDVLAALDHMLATPDAELAARRRIDMLEQRILQELRTSERASAPQAGAGGR